MRSVRIISENGIGHGTKVTDANTGETIHGVTKLEFGEITVDSINEVKMSLGFTELDVCANHVSFLAIDPATGKFKNVKSIQFEDGTTWEA